MRGEGHVELATLKGGIRNSEQAAHSTVACAAVYIAILTVHVPKVFGQGDIQGRKPYFGVKPLVGGDMAKIREDAHHSRTEDVELFDQVDQTRPKQWEDIYRGDGGK